MEGVEEVVGRRDCLRAVSVDEVRERKTPGKVEVVARSDKGASKRMKAFELA